MPVRRSLLVVAVVATLCALSAAAQEPRPARLVWEGLRDGDGVDLTLGWRFRAGDDPAWSAHVLDDSGWEIADPQMPRRSSRGVASASARMTSR